MPTKLKAVFDGEVFRPIGTVELNPGTECELTIEAVETHDAHEGEVDALTAIAAMAVDMGIRDLADRHHQYAHPVVDEQSFVPSRFFENDWSNPTDALFHAFRGTGARAALDRYASFASDSGWSLPHKVSLWNAGAVAADVASPMNIRREGAGQIYDSLVGWWQVFRPSSVSACWSADEVFDHFFARDSILNRRAGWRASQWRQWKDELLTALHSLRGLKPNREYPWMAVSKFAHFANPRLIPIYDTAVVWEIALHGAFLAEFEAFRDRKRLSRSPDGPEFLRNYAAWIGELVSADKSVMSIFADWLREQVRDDSNIEVPADVETCEAAAGEMILIGAAHLLRDARQ